MGFLFASVSATLPPMKPLPFFLAALSLAGPWLAMPPGHAAEAAKPATQASPAPDAAKKQASEPAVAPAEEDTDFLRYLEDEEAETDALQTAVVRYENALGVQVDLVGAVHIADKAYFEELNRRFKNYDAVLYELVGRPMDLRDPDNLKPGDGDENLQWLGHMQELMRKHLKLESQLKLIDYTPANFVHADMSVETFFKTQEDKKESFLTLWVRAMQAQAGMKRDRPEPGMIELMMIMRQEDPSMDLKRLVGQEFDSMEKLMTGMESGEGTSIISERNRHALEVMDRVIAAGKKKLAIFYGAGHLPNMEERLLARGFKKLSAEWVTAWDLPWGE